MDWNDETIARIRELWAEGLTTAEIGRRMGITKNAVVGKAHRLKLPPRPSPIRRGDAPDHKVVVRRVATPAMDDLDAPLAPAVGGTRPGPGVVLLRPVPAQPRPSSRVSSCCWPLGDPGTPSFRFCGDPALAAKPYCAEHAALAYVRVRDRREDAA